MKLSCVAFSVAFAVVSVHAQYDANHPAENPYNPADSEHDSAGGTAPIQHFEMPFEEPEYATASFWEFFEKFQESSRSTTTPVPSPTPGMSVDDVMDDDEIIYPITDDEVAFNFYPNLDYPSSEIEVDDEEETEDDEETFGTYPGYPPFANYPGYTSSVAEPESTDEATSTSEDATPSFPTDVAAAEDAADPAPLPTPEANQGVRFARF